MLWLFLHRETDLFTARHRVLHFAPEPMFFRALGEAEGVDYLPVDRFMPGYTYPEGTRDMDITALALPDASVDAILCSHVLEHVPEDRRAMEELFRVLRPGGWAVVHVPQDYERAQTDEDPTVTDPQERERRFGRHDHVRLYGRDFADKLSAVGFEVEQIAYPSTFSAEDQFRYGLPGDHIVHVCRRSA